MHRGSVYTVGQVNRYIKGMFAQDFLLSGLCVRGEVSNLKYHTSGHIYFTLKDETGTLACIMFAGDRRGLTFPMKGGEQVQVTGQIRIFERDGRYQLYAKEIRPDGQGALWARFEQLKKELEERGMFAPEYKQPIPAYVRTLGVVTASTGAAIRDIINITHRRNPYVQILLYPALVQGEGAAESIARGIRTLDARHPDCIIVGRGGGSLEDLWAFNEEAVAQAVFDCETPVISAVGHETDTTITDYVADLRAPTPSAAAELAVFDFQAWEDGLMDCKRRLTVKMRDRIERERMAVHHLELRLRLYQPEYRISSLRQTVADEEDRLIAAMTRRLERERHLLQLKASRLEDLSPLKRLSGGYAFVADEAGRGIRSVRQVEPEQRLVISLPDGQLRAQVLSVTGEAGPQASGGSQAMSGGLQAPSEGE